MSALPPKADIADSDEHVRFVPIADMPRSQRAAATRPTPRKKTAQASGLFILNPKVNGLLLLHIKIAPIFTPHLTICAPVLAPFLTTGPPILTSAPC
jgi:hypothetical protein